jgi:hypothetical protein
MTRTGVELGSTAMDLVRSSPARTVTQYKGVSWKMRSNACESMLASHDKMHDISHVCTI